MGFIASTAISYLKSVFSDNDDVLKQLDKYVGLATIVENCIFYDEECRKMVDEANTNIPKIDPREGFAAAANIAAKLFSNDVELLVVSNVFAVLDIMRGWDRTVMWSMTLQALAETFIHTRMKPDAQRYISVTQRELEKIIEKRDEARKKAFIAMTLYRAGQLIVDVPIEIYLAVKLWRNRSNSFEETLLDVFDIFRIRNQRIDPRT